MKKKSSVVGFQLSVAVALAACGGGGDAHAPAASMTLVSIFQLVNPSSHLAVALPPSATGEVPVYTIDPAKPLGIYFDVPSPSTPSILLNGGALTYSNDPGQQINLGNACTPFYSGVQTNLGTAEPGDPAHWEIAVTLPCNRGKGYDLTLIDTSLNRQFAGTPSEVASVTIHLAAPP